MTDEKGMSGEQRMTAWIAGLISTTIPALAAVLADCHGRIEDNRTKRTQACFAAKLSAAECVVMEIRGQQ